MRPGSTSMNADEDVRRSTSVQNSWVGGHKRQAAAAYFERNWVLGQRGVGGGTGQENARQHIYIAARLVVAMGEDRARTILNMHESILKEDGTLTLGAAWNDARKMDVINNEVGVSIGLEVLDRYGEPGEACSMATCVLAGGFYDDDAVGYLEQRTTQVIDSGRAVWIGSNCLPSCAPKESAPS